MKSALVNSENGATANCVQSGLIATLIGLLTYLIYKNTLGKNAALMSSVPRFIDWPVVGDLLHLPGDPYGFYVMFLERCKEARQQGHKILKTRFFSHTIVSLFHADAVEKLLSTTDFIQKSNDYEFVKKWLGTGLITSTGAKWHRRRKLLAPSFHFSILGDSLQIINEHAVELRDVLLSKLSNFKPGEDDSFNIFPHLTYNALDTICESAMGMKMHSIHDHSAPYVKAIELVKRSIARRAHLPWYWPDIIYDNVASGKAENKAVNFMHEFGLKVIRERKEVRAELGGESNNAAKRKKRVFLDTLLECQKESESGKPEEIITENDILEEVDTFMFAGHDTVSCTLAYTVQVIGDHPEVQQRCQEEIDEVISLADEKISMTQLGKLSYLEACIKEALRLFPPVTWFGRQLPKETELGGHMIPANTSVFVFTAGLHRDPEFYPEPERFNPDRWLDVSRTPRRLYSYVPFSAGPRNCVGQKFAMMELKVVLSMLLRNFTIMSTKKTEDIESHPILVLEPSGGIWVTLEPRQ